MKDKMYNDLIVVDIDSSIYDVGKKMLEYDIGFILVNEKDKIVGVLTDRDIVTRIVANKDDKISGYITRDIKSVDINDDINKALETMKKHKIKRLLVTDNDKVVGIVSLSNLLDSENVMDTIKEIFAVNRNSDLYITKVNEFYL